jgi:CRP-like cAMP-binding protein
VAQETAPHRNELLSALAPADCHRLAPHLKLIHLQLGAVLYEPSDRIRHAYFPHTAMISLAAVMEGGHAIEIAVIGKDSVVPAVSGLGLSRAFSRAVVQGSGEASRIAVTALRDAVRDGPTLRELLLRHHELVLLQIQQTAACNAMHEAAARLARWLLQYIDASANGTIALTQDFLSQLLGVRRETVNASIQSLEKGGALRVSRSQIEILDRNKLQKVACECYRVISTRRKQVLTESTGGLTDPAESISA